MGVPLLGHSLLFDSQMFLRGCTLFQMFLRGCTLFQAQSVLLGTRDPRASQLPQLTLNSARTSWSSFSRAQSRLRAASCKGALTQLLERLFTQNESTRSAREQREMQGCTHSEREQRGKAAHTVNENKERCRAAHTVSESRKRCRAADTVSESRERCRAADIVNENREARLNPQ